MTRALLMLYCALLALVAAASAVPVTGPTVIAAPGTYELGADLAGAGANASIEIRAPDVVLEGNGHAIVGNGTGDQAGILVQAVDGASADRVEVRNLTVRGWQDGVHAIGVSDLLLDRVSARENGEHGLYLFSVSNSTITNCTSVANQGSGIVLSDVSQDNVVADSTASENGHNGLMLIAATRNRLFGNTVRSNGVYGIDGYLARENVVTDNLFVNANNTHIEEFDRNTWSLAASAGPNIAGGPQRGGNFWGQPDGKGHSQITPDTNGDGFCDTPYTIRTGNVDELPLKGTSGTAPTATSAPGFGAIGALAVLASIALLSLRR